MNLIWYDGNSLEELLKNKVEHDKMSHTIQGRGEFWVGRGDRLNSTKLSEN